MLEMLHGCECCDVDLPADARNACICTCECTFCADCADSCLNNCCPNCGGELVARPRRSLSKLANNPASIQRIYKPEGCPAAHA